DLLTPEIRKDLFNRIHTKIADSPPSRYGVAARVKNSLIAGGCRIEGRVENSIIFRDVYIRRGALIKNSIIMQKCFIGRDVRLENAILDKFAQVRQGVIIEGEEYNPVIIEKKAKLRIKGVVF
ncbi:MAG: glucose-1-phosphate adenylyltransferase subunit GlgD, partial [Desulfotomaculaceae bacterium]